MNKTFKLTFALFLLLVLALTWLEATEPEPVNWSPSYVAKDKIPLGSFVFFESWKKSISSEIEEIKIPPYEFFMQDSLPQGTYFFLNHYIAFDDDELNNLLEWVEKGNSAFISADYLSMNLLDTLDLEINEFISNKDFTSRPKFNLVNPELKSAESYKLDHDIEAIFFSKIDTARHTVLGVANLEEEVTSKEQKINFIKAPFGNGQFLLHTSPQAFSNYFLLSENNHEYAEKVLSYIDDNGQILWDGYYKSGKTFYSSPLYILLNRRSLKWAYYFVIIAGVLFIIFEGKRKQRPIPVVNPQKNQTYEYTQTIADLYLEQKQYKELATKKNELFLEYIRLHYRIPTQEINEQFYLDLSSRAGKTTEEAKELFNRINQIKSRAQISKEEFLVSSRAINEFKDIKDGKRRNTT
ncbi:DUF4350 domain-containing protein [Autumnicola psychrophila]|uniref:DUF4350 domain-containing protein n=1 Tax=Autumnicola psychrophila TaxID=3075592 RepID=A0ABU3DV59_9FLAO|nr:DUF4350 domain-containing protein [Zunongwangia sp. F225]MDT0687601.1 DUF4350 domain-containing protein [Zunongwangia sp. F225]